MSCQHEGGTYYDPPHPENDTAFGEVIEVILQNGLEGLAEAMSIVINQAMNKKSATKNRGQVSKINIQCD